MAAFLRAVAGDVEIKVLSTGRDKMRLRLDYDARKSGGYRDVQLSVQLRSPEAVALGVHEHIAEVQLHLAAIYARRTEAGHAAYVTARNLRGE